MYPIKHESVMYLCMSEMLISNISLLVSVAVLSLITIMMCL
jgi:hypothetical protein